MQDIFCSFDKPYRKIYILENLLDLIKSGIIGGENIQDSKYNFLSKRGHTLEYYEDYARLIPYERHLVLKIDQKYIGVKWQISLGRVISVTFENCPLDTEWNILGRYLHFSHLMTIRFINCNMQEVPRWILRIRNLIGLAFENMSFDLFPMQILECKNLLSLKMKKCGLKRLPDDFEKLSQLRSVNLEQNNFETLPEILLKIPSLRVIRLNDNPIIRIPDSWISLPNLKDLRLHNCKITRIPEDLYRIPFVLLNNNPLEINNHQMNVRLLWGKPWRFEEILAKCRRGELLEELEILHPLFAKYRTQLLAQCEGIQNAAVDQLRNIPVGIAAMNHGILL